MYNTLLRLFLVGSITETGLANAVAKGWITEDQKTSIIASKAE